MIPETLWLVFSNCWIDVRRAPADAADWLKRGYLTLVQHGKLTGYAIAPPGYRLIVGD